MRERDGKWHGSNGAVMEFGSCEGDDSLRRRLNLNCFCELYPEFFEPFGVLALDVFVLQCSRVLAQRRFWILESKY